MHLKTIGIIHSPFKEKFGTPRQPGLVNTTCSLELLPPYNHIDAVRGLDGFSHVWISFIFHQTAAQGWHNLVRPPRLGGNKKIGVFASRSNFRPNPLGLSLLELLEIKNKNGVQLLLGGADLIDGTPVIDIKPYLPFIEAKTNTKSGFVNAAPEKLDVNWSHEALAQIKTLPPSFKILLEDILTQDPRPAYQTNNQRVYGMKIEKWNIKFSINNNQLEILHINEFF